MKIARIVALSFLFLLSRQLHAQNNPVFLKSGIMQPHRISTGRSIDSIEYPLVRFQGKTFLLIQFQILPDVSTRKLLSANGIELLEYIPQNTFTATVSGNMNPSVLLQARVNSVMTFSPQQKMETRLSRGSCRLLL